MWAVAIVVLAPDVEVGLAIVEIHKLVLAQEVGLEGAVQPFIFALGLGVVGTPMDDLDP